ncbi:MAG: carboxylesterase/lipase family protein [Terriglobia bacterium]
MRNILHTIIFTVLAVGPLPAAINPTVKVDGGLVSGISGRDPSIITFKGIPFAAPPIGDLRWRAPNPVLPWQGVRRANQFSASCVQNVVTERKPWTHEFMTHGEISEDCLYLNVWTPAKSSSEKRPVFVYLYGGGFMEGSAAVPVYDGEGLAKKGLVMVTINYRLGILGFLALPELTCESGHQASGNYGLLDQIAALRWVHENISHFGGDATRVTIAGQSAGGMSVHDLTASPLARGLFQRAIVESGGSSIGRGGIPLRPHSLAEAEAAGQKFAEAKGAKSLAELRAMSWQKLIEPVPENASGSTGAPPGLRFAPIVDGYSLPAPFMEIIAQGNQNDVVTLTGANLGELGGLGPPAGPVPAETFRNRAREKYGDVAGEFLKLYPAATDEQVGMAQAQSARDQALVAMYLWARERSKTAKTKVYEYLWDHTLPGPDAGRFGAFHTSEVPYVLNTLYMSDRPFTEADRKIADMMSSYWANFAASGDPNGKGLARWPSISEKPEIMEVGDKTEPIPVAGSPEKFSFFATFLSK